MNNKIIGPDGVQRSKDQEAKLNLDTLAALSTPSGKELLKYLKSITTETVTGPEISDSALRHLEGRRFLVGIMSQRMALGHKEKAKK